MVAYTFSLIHPEKVAGVVTLGVPFMPPGFFKSHQALPEGFYMKRWQEPGRAEADFGRFDAKTVVRNIYIMFSRSEIPIAGEDQEIMDLVEPSTPLPSWFTEADLSAYGDLYQKSGFQTALKVPYRSFEEKTGSPQQGVNDPKVEVTALLIMGEEDYVLKFPGMEEYLKSGEVKKYVPNLEIVYLPQGCHFVHEQFPDQSHQALPEGFYMRRWKEPGRAEADFGRFDAKTVVRNIYIMFSRSEIPIAGEDQEIMDLVDPLDPLPSWFTEDDLAVYGELYHKSGFQTALQVPYRSFAEKMGSPQQGPNDLKVEAPALLIMGEKDYMTKLPGAEEYLKSGEVKKYVPNLEIVYLPEGCHFVHEQFPDQVNQLVLNFLEHYKC
ncbi:hypothetical protein M8C21_022705 [Ambrosia artemisiifolia]|uniref:Uncharacterized protein n=1 Tax=Ambrosia artemisiifolia TaxID=4212 RepID=A0AAD5GBE1_AMBAR|nr:hypothetical protein M8C21_022705 [Ambrosia artemisiifolia]